MRKTKEGYGELRVAVITFETLDMWHRCHEVSHGPLRQLLR